MAVTEPLWELAELFPEQGNWTEADYMRLPGNRLIEFSDRKVEFLPMPNQRHQEIVGFLYTLLVLMDGSEVYTEAGVYSPGQVARSVTLEGFSVNVTQVFTL
jgi:hypothetical protein